MPRRGCQGPARSGVQPLRAGTGFPQPPPQPPPPPPGRAGLRSSEPSGGLGTGPRSSVPPRCVAGSGFIILIDSSCSPTPWGPRPRKGGGGGICGPYPSPRPKPQLGLPALGSLRRPAGQGGKGGSPRRNRAKPSSVLLPTGPTLSRGFAPSPGGYGWNRVERSTVMD